MNRDYFEIAAALLGEFPAAQLKSEAEIWDFLVRKAAAAIGCEAASVFEADEARKILTFKKTIGPVAGDLEGVSFAWQGLAGWCAENRQPVMANDAESDPRFTKKVDYGTGFRTKNVIAVPALCGGRLLGVVEFVNSSRGGFCEADLKLASMLTAYAARDAYIARLEATVKQLSLKGESTINNLSGGFIGVDLEGKIIFFNPKAMEIFAVEGEYMGRNIIKLFHLAPEIVAAIGDVLKQGKTVRRREFRCVVNGAEKIIGYSSINIKGVDGVVIGAGVIFQDITGL